MLYYMLFTSYISGHGNIIGPLFPSVHLSVFPSVCPSFSTLTPVPLSIRGCSLMTSRMSLMVKVIGQRSRSPG